MKITLTQAKQLSKKYNINLKIVKIDEWLYGLNAELTEHGKKLSKLTNITNDDLDLTAKIAIAHLIEDPRYYYYLRMMENKRDKYWDKRIKPSIFNK